MPEQFSAIVPGRDPDRLIKWFIGLVLLGFAALLGGVALLYRAELRVGWLGGRAKRADLPLTATATSAIIQFGWTR